MPKYFVSYISYDRAWGVGHATFNLDTPVRDIEDIQVIARAIGENIGTDKVAIMNWKKLGGNHDHDEA